MIDIHCHVLPAVDDGAGTLEESLQMLHAAAAAGTTDIVATPHANSQFPFDETRINAVFDQLSELSTGFIRLHLGCDFHLSYENLVDALQNPSKFTINRKRYLMVELPDIVSPAAARAGLRQLLNVRIVPIITHPERNESIGRNLREMQAWRAMGCLLQVTGQSLLGRFGPAAQTSAEQLFAGGMVDFVASDAHDLIDRPPDLSSAYEFIRSHYNRAVADRVLVENPLSVLWGEHIDVSRTRGQKRFFGLLR
jgi:protein-tyrosine phosphatase